MHRLRRLVPILAWLPRYRRADLAGDLGAGLTTAVMLIPQAMAYALLAGLPPIVGLYATIPPLLVYAVFGSSPKLAVGPVAMDSLLVAAALGSLALAGHETPMLAAAALAVMVGLVQLTMGALRLGFVVNFLSRPVLSGFTSAAALVIDDHAHQAASRQLADGTLQVLALDPACHPLLLKQVQHHVGLDRVGRLEHRRHGGIMTEFRPSAQRRASRSPCTSRPTSPRC